MQKIQEDPDVNQWNYVKDKDNPPDNASRGLNPRKETLNSRWFTGPTLLWQGEELQSSYSEITCVGEDDPEIKKRMSKSMQYNQLMMYMKVLKKKES